MLTTLHFARGLAHANTQRRKSFSVAAWVESVDWRSGERPLTPEQWREIGRCNGRIVG